MNIPALIAAIVLPPLGAFLIRGMGRDFFIAIGLTMLFFLPGMLFSLFIVCGGSTDRPAAAIARRWRAIRPVRA
ncbi:YqaE/Pmp3 family membrane protein [Sphingobium boeckii]|uniref:Uncharacterized membrane protein YqaE (UPF0057 family) n=1 Tax=Sphingobium boeckii TaxID=1082345 RepID=A0A7W9AFI4_9SPHN|nr:YqaE/Pmp3 family membrane protein [Sphingobium boeckii]MBB5684496.1 uncharacterized membrane protein YqaE (UPF0057 family) [Sphingobium boeckii]